MRNTAFELHSPSFFHSTFSQFDCSANVIIVVDSLYFFEYACQVALRRLSTSCFCVPNSLNHLLYVMFALKIPRDPKYPVIPKDRQSSFFTLNLVGVSRSMTSEYGVMPWEVVTDVCSVPAATREWAVDLRALDIW